MSNLAMSNNEAAAKPVSLSPSQAAMLKSCLEHEGNAFPVTDWHKGVRGRAIVRKLVGLGLIRPVNGEGSEGEADDPAIFAYALTEAGSDALGVPHTTEAEATIATPAENAASADDGAAEPAPAHVAEAPRAGTKLHAVLVLLREGDGVPIEAIMEKTGWLAHTSRAALTGLRKRGYRIESRRGADKRATYRLLGAKG